MKYLTYYGKYGNLVLEEKKNELKLYKIWDFIKFDWLFVVIITLSYDSSLIGKMSQ